MNPEVQLSISTVMTGQEVTNVDTGGKSIASTDLIILGTIVGGVQTASFQMEVEQAMAVASQLVSSCSQVVNARVGDDGKPLPLLERIAILSGRAPQAPEVGAHDGGQP